MKVKVKETFADKYTYQMYSVGQTIDVDDKRAEDLIKRGLASPLESPKAAKGTKKKKED